MAITTSQRAWRARATPSRIVATAGSPATGMDMAVTPAAFMASTRGAARLAAAPVTTSAREPMDAAAAGSSCRVPAPKRMRVAVANSNGTTHQSPSAGSTL